MSLLEYSSSVQSSALHQDELEEAFLAWARSTTKPDVVVLGQHRIPMVELSHHLSDSQTTLATSACHQIGLPSGVNIATAVAALLHATIDADGPRCRSFRAASYYLRGLASLDIDLPAINGYPGSSAEHSRSHSHVL